MAVRRALSFSTVESGTNQSHGSGQFRLRNEALNANTFGINAQGITRAALNVKNYSATFCGPIILPKLYNGNGFRHSRPTSD